MKEDRLTRRGFLSKLTNWIPSSILAVIPLAWLGRSKPYHFQEVAPEKSSSSGLLAAKFGGCSCTCQKKSLQSAASNKAINTADSVVACDCGSGPKNSSWQAAARSNYQKSN